MCICDSISEYLAANELCVDKLAKDAGMALGDLTAMLSGERTMDCNDLRDICYALRVSAATFITPKIA